MPIASQYPGQNPADMAETIAVDFVLPTSDASEQDLIRLAQQALSRCNWVVGQCACEWTRRYARGRTDADFAQLVGLSPDQVYQRRRVWETFGDVAERYPSLRWSHFYIALNWDDAPECLQWAEENGATVAETRAWRRTLRGEDLESAADDESSPLGEDPAIGRLATIPADVRAPDDHDLERRPGWSQGDRENEQGDDSDIPFAATVSSSNRETAGSDGEDYAPFRKDAGSAPPKETAEEPVADERPAGQIAKRVISTLERIVTVLTPQIVAAFRTLPENDRSRLVTAVRVLADRVTALDSQRS